MSVIATGQDYMAKALCLEGKIRMYALRSTRLVEESRRRHGTWPTATAALGRTLSVGVIMGAMLKGSQKLTIQILADGPLGKVVVDANSTGGVRGYVQHPHTHLPLNTHGKLDVGGAVGRDGNIYVTKDIGMKEPYHGSSPIINGEIGEDFTYYFAQSEQTPSACAVGVIVNPDNSVKASGGYVIQLMPGVEEDWIAKLESRLGEVPSVSSMVEQGYSPEEMIESIFPDEEIKWLEPMPVRFECQCSMERVQQTLISLGQDELKSMIREDGQAEVNCHFCNEHYHLDQGQLEQLLEEIEG